MTNFNELCEVTRIGGSWGGNCYRKMTLLDMINWMNKYNYKLTRRVENTKYGIIYMTYEKQGCNTYYDVKIVK